MWEFRKNNTFGALAFSSYGAFWITFAWYVRYVEAGLPAVRAHEATGLFLLAWTIFTAYMLLASFGTTRVLTVVFAFLSRRPCWPSGSWPRRPTPRLSTSAAAGLVTAFLLVHSAAA